MNDTSIAGQLCVLDPCGAAAPALFADSRARVCPIGMHCTPRGGSTTFGRCTNEAHLLEQCDARTPCGDGLACLAHPGPDGTHIRCENIPNAERVTPADRAVCWFPVHEGQDCDSNAADIQRGAATGCLPCEEGTWCVPVAQLDPTRPGSTRSVCVRTCNNAAGTGPDASQCACGAVAGAFPDGGPPAGTGGATCAMALSSIHRDSAPFETIGPFLCSACLPDRLIGDCTAQTGLACCDGEASCTELATGGHMCCREPAGQPGVDDGAACDPGSRLQQCCPGSFCNDHGHCEACASGGREAGKLACCPGSQAIELPGAPTISVCADCTDIREAADLRTGDRTARWCSNDSFLVATDPTGSSFRVDAAAIPSPDLPYPLEYQGGIGGPLVFTQGRTFQAQYSLAPTHHTFLFATSANSPTLGNGTRFIELPPDDDTVEAPVTVVLPDSDWTAFRMYDLGQCSAFMPWSLLADQFAIQLNQTVGGIGHIAPPVTTTGISLTPELSGTPGLPYGLFEPASRVHYSASFTSASVGGCSNVTVTLEGDLSLGTAPGFNVGPDARASDATLHADAGTGAICTVTPDGANAVCALPVAPSGTGRVWSSHTWTFPLRAGLYQWAGAGVADELAHLRDAFAAVECRTVRDRYVCHLPRVQEDAWCCPSAPNCPVPSSATSSDPDPCANPARSRIDSALPPDRTNTYAVPTSVVHLSCSSWTPSASGGTGGSCGEGATTFDHDYHPALDFVDLTMPAPRPVDFVPDALDLAGDLPTPTITVSPGCGAEQLIIGQIRSGLAIAQQQVASQIGQVLAVFGTSATGSFGISPSQLQSCVTDDDCHRAPQFGGLRDRCSMAGLCDTVHLELRRLNVMPGGVDVVLAATSTDPQIALFGTTHTVGIGGLSTTLSCQPTREYPISRVSGRPYSLTSFTPPDITFARDGVTLGPTPSLARVTTGTLCTGAAGESASCICPQTGTDCSTIGLLLSRFAPPAGATRLRCAHNPAPGGALQCCTATGARLRCATPIP